VRWQGELCQRTAFARNVFHGLGNR
jgi:hypothetical protein